MSIRSLGCGACREASPPFPFTMAFQPVVDLRDRRIDAYEALVRGPDGEGAGHVLGLVNNDNRYSFDQACRVKAIEMAAALGIDRQLNINFMPNAVYDPKACIRLTLEAAARSNFPLDRLTFEIVEHEDVAEPAHLARIIAEYRRHGFKIALDDFATGYSGIGRLAELRPDIVKLDRALVAGCDQDDVRLRIAAHMASLCADIGIKLVVEGVERAEELAALASVGIRFVQGFYFARPMLGGVARDQDIRFPEPAAAAAAAAATA